MDLYQQWSRLDAKAPADMAARSQEIGVRVLGLAHGTENPESVIAEIRLLEAEIAARAKGAVTNPR